MHVRESAESIAFYNGQQRERQEAAARFSASVDNKAGLLNFERNLNFFTRWYKYLVQIVPAVVIGPQYFAGKVPLGAISQSFFSFNHVLTDLSIVVNEFTGPNGISSFSAQVSHLDLQSVYACMHACRYACMCVGMHACMHTNVHAHTHARAHTHTHTHTHVYIRAQIGGAP